MRRLTSTLLSTLAAATAVVSIAPIASANPFVGNHDGWTYFQDSASDGTDIDNVGGAYEIYGFAYKQNGNTLSFAINSAMGIGGNYEADVAGDQNIGYGDLMLNFGGTQYGVRFAGTNDSGVAETGLYSNITTMDVTGTNAGWSSASSYKDGVEWFGGEARVFGDERDEAILGNTAERQSGNVLQSGTRVGGISLLSAESLLDFGAAFGDAPIGSETFGFSFEMTEEMTGAFIAQLWLECINDGVGMDGYIARLTGLETPTDVPEPAGLLGLLGATAFGGSKLLRRRGTGSAAE